MKERPIIFSAPMVRAILEGRKTMTRRVVKPQPKWVADPSIPFKTSGADPSGIILCPYGQPGAHLYVKETFRLWDSELCGCGSDRCYCPPDRTPIYRADEPHKTAAEELGPWKPSIFMPRKYSRITLEITGVRVERLQAITGKDVFAEGVDNGASNPAMGVRYENMQRMAFEDLWQSLNAKRPGCSWDDNPFVWVVEFKRVEAKP